MPAWPRSGRVQRDAFVMQRATLYEECAASRVW